MSYSSETISVLYILCGGLFFQILSESLLSVYRSLEKLQVIAFFSTCFRALSAIVIALSIYLSVGFYGIVAAFTIGNTFIFFAVLVLFLHDFNLIDGQITPSRWIELVRQGVPFFISAVLTMLYGKINVIILSKLVTEHEIGFYMAALTLVESLFFIPTAFLTSAFPAFSRMYGSSPDALRKAYRKINKYLIIVAVAVSLGTILVSEEIVSLIFGARFAPAATVLKVLILLWAFSFFSNAQSILLWSIQRERLQVVIMLFGVVISVTLNYAFIYFYGYIGAALAIVLTEFIILVLMTVVLWRFGFRYVPDLYILRLVFVAGGMVLLVKLLLPFNLLAAIMAGGGSYLALLFVAKVFDEEDILWFRSLIRKGSA